MAHQRRSGGQALSSAASEVPISLALSVFVNREVCDEEVWPSRLFSTWPGHRCSLSQRADGKQRAVSWVVTGGGHPLEVLQGRVCYVGAGARQHKAAGSCWARFSLMGTVSGLLRFLRWLQATGGPDLANSPRPEDMPHFCKSCSHFRGPLLDVRALLFAGGLNLMFGRGRGRPLIWHHRGVGPS